MIPGYKLGQCVNMFQSPWIRSAHPGDLYFDEFVKKVSIPVDKIRASDQCACVTYAFLKVSIPVDKVRAGFRNPIFVDDLGNVVSIPVDKVRAQSPERGRNLLPSIVSIPVDKVRAIRGIDEDGRLLLVSIPVDKVRA